MPQARRLSCNEHANLVCCSFVVVVVAVAAACFALPSAQALDASATLSLPADI